MNRLTLRAPRFTLVGAALALTVVVAACGGSSHNTNISSSATTAPSTGSSGASGGAATGNPGGGGGGGGAFPGASGSVAALTPPSMEVQNQQTGQVTVSWTTATRFSQSVTVPATSVAVGDCITATGTSANGAITATAVTITQPSSSGSCTGGFAGRRGRPGGTSGTGTGPSSTFPARTGGTRPAGAPGANFSFASGKVTAVTASALTVDGFSSAGFRPGANTSTTTPTAAPVTVDLKSTTTYHTTRTATASSLAVGDCVTATGSTSSNGSVTASVIRITSTGGQACTTGAGRFGGGFGGGFGGAGGGSGGGTTSNG